MPERQPKPTRPTQVAASWIDAASSVLHRRGPMELFALLEAALQIKPVKKPLPLLAQALFRHARERMGEMEISEYPAFRLKSANRPKGFPVAGREAAAYKILIASREYMDVRLIAERATAAGYLRSVSACVEYWMYEALRGNKPVFAQRGSLRIHLAEAKATRPPQTKAVPGPGVQNIHETHLESLIVEDLDAVEPGLTLIGRQYQAPPVGRIDLLCRDRKGAIVVIEIKKFNAGTDSIIDQIARYIGWARHRVATPGQAVRGIIIVSKPDEKLVYAASALPGLTIKCFDLSLRDYRRT